MVRIFPIRRALSILGLALLLAAAPAAATTFVMVSDADLADQASVIAEVGVAAVESAPVSGTPATDYLVEIERLVKGYTAGSSIVVRVPGGVRGDGIGLKIWGAPLFEEGSRALLFLRERPDGTYGVLHLMLGAFHEVEVAGTRRLALRDLSGAREVTPRGGRLEEHRSEDRPRDLARFTSWLQDRALGIRRPADYHVELSPGAIQSIHEKFTLFRDDFGRNLRWFQFDTGGSVIFRAHSSGQPGVPGGGFAEFQAGLRVWNDDPGTPINYVYGGTTDSRSGLKDFDSINSILFNDPNSEIEGTYPCGGGGVLAIGGPWYDTGVTGRFRGITFARILGADIVTNDGLMCFFQNTGTPGKAAEELFGHELGHTLGLGHSSERRGETNPALRDALMFALIHDDGRGARLGADDRAAIRFLYNPSISPSSNRCANSATSLCLLRRFRVEVAWQNQFDGSNGVGRAVPRTNATGFFSFGDRSNIELMVKALDFGDTIKVFYGQLTNLRFTVTVTDTRTGTVKTYTNTPGECGGFDNNAFAPVTSGAAGASKVAGASRAAGAAAASCRPDRETLCLLGGRFAVEVDWRNPGNGTSGTGGAAALSQLTGTFFFTDPGNIELMTKLVDFGDRISFFYGTLSNLEYTIRVTDTSTGVTKTYSNPNGRFCGGLDVNAF